MSESNQFGWVEFYKALANKLLEYKNDRTELVNNVFKIYDESGIKAPKLEEDNSALEDFDPFSVFGIFNKMSMKKTTRRKLIMAVSKVFNINVATPDSFDGIPTVFNTGALFYPFKSQRKPDDIDELWELFIAAQDYAKKPSLSAKEQLSNHIDYCVKITSNAIAKISTALYWIEPDTYLNLDHRTQWYIYESGKLPPKIVKKLPKLVDKLSGQNYFLIIDLIGDYLKNSPDNINDFKELSFATWSYSELENKKNALDKKSTKKEVTEDKETVQSPHDYCKKYSAILKQSKNIILRGAPGTGKTHLAQEIAMDIVCDGDFTSYEELNDEQKSRIEFVQFHPSYDYTDFVEGLRPKCADDDDGLGFELRDGIFKTFIDRARKNYENSHKEIELLEKELSVQETLDAFFSKVEAGEDTFKISNGNEFTITGIDSHIRIFVPGNASSNKLAISVDDIRVLLESGKKIDTVKEVRETLGKTYRDQKFSYVLAVFNAINKMKKPRLKETATKEKEKEYVFIIDEINRGEISKIFGELFFSVDPGYRGEKGEVLTQYANLHRNPKERFYIPKNVYIIGTMNDIDRSVDSFDFAMRRRFRFVELKANECTEMLDVLNDADLKEEIIHRMKQLNNAIARVPDLNENYQIGAAYFLNLDKLNFEQLWEDYIQPLLQEYVRGLYDEDKYLREFKDAYDLKITVEDDNGTAQD